MPTVVLLEVKALGDMPIIMGRHQWGVDGPSPKCNPGPVMPDPWSNEEVRLAIEDYFSMLREELQGLDYNKTGHRRLLIPRLQGRNDGSVERKHQNISAVLVELGLPYIDGYKPLGNYQRLLRDAVAGYVEQYAKGLEELAAIADAIEPVAPAVPDFAAILVEPPDYQPAQAENDAPVVPEIVRKLDFTARDARNRKLGRSGEQFVLEFEEARLVKAGRKELASKIEWISESRGDGAGYDIASFDLDGRERLIEVKTTNYGRSFPFLVTRNELSVSRARNNYSLYRVFDFHRDPRLFMLPGAISAHCRLEPTVYRASFGGAA